MDSLHAIGFYVSATLSLGGALLVAFLPTRQRRGAALAATGLGIAGLDLSLSAGLTALVVLITFWAIALLLSGPAHRLYELPVGGMWRQLGAVGAAGLFGALAYSAYRGDFVNAAYVGGTFGSAAIGRFLLDHDVLATEAIGALVLVALVGATAAWRVRERSR